MLDTVIDELVGGTLTYHAQIRKVALVLRETRRGMDRELRDASDEYQLAMHTLGTIGVPWAVDGKRLSLVERIQLLARRRMPPDDVRIPTNLIEDQRKLIEQLTNKIGRAILMLTVPGKQPEATLEAAASAVAERMRAQKDRNLQLEETARTASDNWMSACAQRDAFKRTIEDIRNVLPVPAPNLVSGATDSGTGAVKR